MLFHVLGNIAIEIIGNDRPLIIGPGDDAQLTWSLGMVPKLTYNKIFRSRCAICSEILSVEFNVFAGS